MKKKKICFVVSTPWNVRSFLKEHIRTLSEYYDVYVISNFTHGDIHVLDDINVRGYKSILIPRKINLILDLLALIRLYKYFRLMKFDAVHSLTPKAGLLTALASYLAQIRVRIHIFTGQVWATTSGPKRILLMNLDKIIARINNYILVDGYSQQKYLREYNIVGSKSIVLGNGSITGVNPSIFKFSALHRQEIRANLNIDDNCIVFGYLGRLTKDKGVDDLLNAFAIINREHANTILLLVGYDEGNYQNYIRQMNFNNIIYYGKTDSPEKIYSSFDIFCLPSYREGFGLSVIEASSVGLPVICSDIYGLKDAFVDSFTGLSHVVKDVFDLAQKMDFLYTHELKRIEIGKNGRSWVIQNYHYSDITLKWLEFYQNKI